MIFRNDTHAELWAEAIAIVGALQDNDIVSGYFGASLYIITGIPGLYERTKAHIHKGWIDFEAILGKGLSSGESVLVALAGNLYNGSFFDQYTPDDIISLCDGEMVELAAKALWLRKQRININTVFD